MRGSGENREVAAFPEANGLLLTPIVVFNHALDYDRVIGRRVSVITAVESRGSLPECGVGAAGRIRSKRRLPGPLGPREKLAARVGELHVHGTLR